MLGSRREFSPFINQLGKMAYGLTLYIDQFIYKSTSLYINSSYDWIRGMISYPQNSYLPYYRSSPLPITTTTHHYHYLPPPPINVINCYCLSLVRNSNRRQR